MRCPGFVVSRRPRGDDAQIAVTCMESALTMTPPRLSATSSANADLPLAVGPAISTALTVVIVPPLLRA